MPKMDAYAAQTMTAAPPPDNRERFVVGGIYYEYVAGGGGYKAYRVIARDDERRELTLRPMPLPLQTGGDIIVAIAGYRQSDVGKREYTTGDIAICTRHAVTEKRTRDARHGHRGNWLLYFFHPTDADDEVQFFMRMPVERAAMAERIRRQAATRR